MLQMTFKIALLKDRVDSISVNYGQTVEEHSLATVLPHSNTDICLSLPGSWFRLLKWQKSMYLLCCVGEPSWRGVLVPAQQWRGSKIVLFDTWMCHWLCCPKKLHPKGS